ncbi:MAG: class I SAM-dependent methyltransferase [Acidimicrobiales bacterium]|nr:class I SAM-dependent methyltransferase [Acidimicrobiales bacterium]
MNRWLSRDDVPRGGDYDERWRRLAESGANIHGEADCVERLLAPLHDELGGTRPISVLDAGCGTGRVGIELARRGYDVVGVDVDPAMLAEARLKHPDGTWLLADLAELDLSAHRAGRRFDLVAAPGNVMIFLAAGTEAVVLQRLAAHLGPGGRLVAGFQLGADRLGLDAYDSLATAAGLALEHRWATWDGEPFVGGDYAVSVHRMP